MSSKENAGSLGARMKCYESAARTVLPQRLPLIIRCDGKSFGTYTKGCEKPFDKNFGDIMVNVATSLCKEIQGAQMAYVQSDEVSVLVHSYKKLNSSPWFDNQVQKIVSVAASIASVTMSLESWRMFSPQTGHIHRNTRAAHFDARAFVLPEAEACNYFVWRQQDAVRNSVQMLARSLYSHKECTDKDVNELREMCLAAGKDWNDIDVRWQRGACVVRSEWWETDDAGHRGWKTDLNIPLFSQDRSYVERLLEVEEK